MVGRHVITIKGLLGEGPNAIRLILPGSDRVSRGVQTTCLIFFGKEKREGGGRERETRDLKIEPRHPKFPTTQIHFVTQVKSDKENLKIVRGDGWVTQLVRKIGTIRLSISKPSRKEIQFERCDKAEQNWGIWGRILAKASGWLFPIPSN